MYLHKLHGNLVYFPAGVWGLEQNQIKQGHKVTRVTPGEKGEIVVAMENKSTNGDRNIGSLRTKENKS